MVDVFLNGHLFQKATDENERTYQGSPLRKLIKSNLNLILDFS